MAFSTAFESDWGCDLSEIEERLYSQIHHGTTDHSAMEAPPTTTGSTALGDPNMAVSYTTRNAQSAPAPTPESALHIPNASASGAMTIKRRLPPKRYYEMTTQLPLRQLLPPHSELPATGSMNQISVNVNFEYGPSPSISGVSHNFPPNLQLSHAALSVLKKRCQRQPNYRDELSLELRKQLRAFTKKLSKERRKRRRDIKKKKKINMKSEDKANNVTKVSNVPLVFISDSEDTVIALSSDDDVLQLDDSHLQIVSPDKTMISKSVSNDMHVFKKPTAQLNTPVIDDDDDDVIFVESSGSVDVIELDAESNSSRGSSNRPGSRQMSIVGNAIAKATVDTPESSNNDFLDDNSSNQSGGRFNFALHGSDFAATPTNRSAPAVHSAKVSGSETSSTSMGESNSLIIGQLASTLFNEVDFDSPAKAILDETNLASFGDYITPRRSESDAKSASSTPISSSRRNLDFLPNLSRMDRNDDDGIGIKSKSKDKDTTNDSDESTLSKKKKTKKDSVVGDSESDTTRQKRTSKKSKAAPSESDSDSEDDFIIDANDSTSRSSSRKKYAKAIQDDSSSDDEVAKTADEIVSTLCKTKKLRNDPVAAETDSSSKKKTPKSKKDVAMSEETDSIFQQKCSSKKGNAAPSESDNDSEDNFIVDANESTSRRSSCKKHAKAIQDGGSSDDEVAKTADESVSTSCNTKKSRNDHVAAETDSSRKKKTPKSKKNVAMLETDSVCEQKRGSKKSKAAPPQSDSDTQTSELTSHRSHRKTVQDDVLSEETEGVQPDGLEKITTKKSKRNNDTSGNEVTARTKKPKQKDKSKSAELNINDSEDSILANTKNKKKRRSEIINENVEVLPKRHRSRSDASDQDAPMSTSEDLPPPSSKRDKKSKKKRQSSLDDSIVSNQLDDSVSETSDKSQKRKRKKPKSIADKTECDSTSWTVEGIQNVLAPTPSINSDAETESVPAVIDVLPAPDQQTTTDKAEAQVQENVTAAPLGDKDDDDDEVQILEVPIDCVSVRSESPQSRHSSDYDFSDFNEMATPRDLRISAVNKMMIQITQLDRSFDDEDFVRRIQSTMSDNPSDWKILPADRYPNRSPRKADLRAFGFCKRCREFGHKAMRCPNKRELICKLCAGRGHTEIRCPNQLCTGCGRPSSVLTTYCRRCAQFRNTRCQTCKMTGHSPNLCPDKWRRYHLTISSNGPLVKPSVPVTQNPRKSCCQCGGLGHVQHECRRPLREHPATNPRIFNYTDILVNRDQQQLIQEPPADVVDTPDPYTQTNLIPNTVLESRVETLTAINPPEFETNTHLPEQIGPVVVGDVQTPETSVTDDREGHEEVKTNDGQCQNECILQLSDLGYAFLQLTTHGKLLLLRHEPTVQTQFSIYKTTQRRVLKISSDNASSSWAFKSDVFDNVGSSVRLPLQNHAIRKLVSFFVDKINDVQESAFDPMNAIKEMETLEALPPCDFNNNRIQALQERFHNYMFSVVCHSGNDDLATLYTYLYEEDPSVVLSCAQRNKIKHTLQNLHYRGFGRTNEQRLANYKRLAKVPSRDNTIYVNNQYTKLMNLFKTIHRIDLLRDAKVEIVRKLTKTGCLLTLRGSVNDMLKYKQWFYNSLDGAIFQFMHINQVACYIEDYLLKLWRQPILSRDEAHEVLGRIQRIEGQFQLQAHDVEALRSLYYRLHTFLFGHCRVEGAQVQITILRGYVLMIRTLPNIDHERIKREIHKYFFELFGKTRYEDTDYRALIDSASVECIDKYMDLDHNSLIMANAYVKNYFRTQLPIPEFTDLSTTAVPPTTSGLIEFMEQQVMMIAPNRSHAAFIKNRIAILELFLKPTLEVLTEIKRVVSIVDEMRDSLIKCAGTYQYLNLLHEIDELKADGEEHIINSKYQSLNMFLLGACEMLDGKRHIDTLRDAENNAFHLPLWRLFMESYEYISFLGPHPTVNYRCLLIQQYHRPTCNGDLISQYLPLANRAKEYFSTAARGTIFSRVMAKNAEFSLEDDINNQGGRLLKITAPVLELPGLVDQILDDCESLNRLSIPVCGGALRTFLEEFMAKIESISCAAFTPHFIDDLTESDYCAFSYSTINEQKIDYSQLHQFLFGVCKLDLGPEHLNRIQSALEMLRSNETVDKACCSVDFLLDLNTTVEYLGSSKRRPFTNYSRLFERALRYKESVEVYLQLSPLFLDYLRDTEEGRDLLRYAGDAITITLSTLSMRIVGTAQYVATVQEMVATYTDTLEKAPCCVSSAMVRYITNFLENVDMHANTDPASVLETIKELVRKRPGVSQDLIDDQYSILHKILFARLRHGKGDEFMTRLLQIRDTSASSGEFAIMPVSLIRNMMEIVAYLTSPKPQLDYDKVIGQMRSDATVEQWVNVEGDVSEYFEDMRAGRAFMSSLAQTLERCDVIKGRLFVKGTQEAVTKAVHDAKQFIANNKQLPRKLKSLKRKIKDILGAHGNYVNINKVLCGIAAKEISGNSAGSGYAKLHAWLFVTNGLDAGPRHYATLKYPEKATRRELYDAFDYLFSSERKEIDYTAMLRKIGNPVRDGRTQVVLPQLRCYLKKVIMRKDEPAMAAVQRLVSIISGQNYKESDILEAYEILKKNHPNI